MDELIYVKAVAEKGNDNELRIVASTETVDRDGEIIKLDGWDLSKFKTNPVFLWAHNSRELPLGKFKSIRKNNTTRQLEGVIEWASPEANPFAQMVKAQFAEGIMNAFSVGFIPLERDAAAPHIITKAELLEVSAVPVPANPDARTLSVHKSLDGKNLDIDLDLDKLGISRDDKNFANELADYLKSVIANKGVVAFTAYPLQDKAAAWDGAAAVKRIKDYFDGEDGHIDFAKFSKGFAWFDNDNKDTLGAYKLPHHDLLEGKFVTNWRGVVAAMAALLGNKAGVSLSDSDKQGVYNHLAKHYQEFGETAPQLKDYTEAELKELFGDLTKDGGDDEQEPPVDEQTADSEATVAGGEAEDLESNPSEDTPGTEIKTAAEAKAIIEKLLVNFTALQAWLQSGNSTGIEDGNKGLDDLPKDDTERMRFVLKTGKLLSEEVLRQLNQRGKQG